ncbi:MAG: glycerophosphodiester phosphodiesterase [Candidatus Yonathbacteria bacterium]|nr:glycerophosphodiester phosphodiesterase [Candidatus Yonathbacteria bacterium]NTW47383.1 glycerophosphodiester phosphodiesterase [Candidatus Yonathbacteria bacterium]
MSYQIAHRGWSQDDPEENTRAAFRRAEEAGVHGVEFDVRWSDARAEPVVCHYPWQEKDAESLDQALAFLSTTTFSILLLELKEYHPFLWSEIKRLLLYYGIMDRTVIFAFPRIAKKFPWETRDKMRLGVISIFPWRVGHYAKLKPAVILFGYDRRVWTQLLFRLFWWDATMRKMFRMHPDVGFIIGVAQNDKHISHIESLEGLMGYTVDRKDGKKEIKN